MLFFYYLKSNSLAGYPSITLYFYHTQIVSPTPACATATTTASAKPTKATTTTT